MPMTNYPVFIISDRTGITAEMLGHSLLTQFPKTNFDVSTLPFVDTDQKVEDAIGEIDLAYEKHGVNPLVFLSFVNDDHSLALQRSRAVLFDLFGAFLGPMEDILGQKSSHSIGISHGMVDPVRYTNRIGAVNHAVHCDDGLHTKDYSKSDLILVGVSRVGKSPVSLYLAMQFGVYCANYPITDHELESSRLPKSIEEHKNKCFWLTIRPERLQQIRQERRAGSSYASAQQCRFEVAQAEMLMRRYKVPHLDTTTMSIEEIATRILQQTNVKRDIF
ncbi:MAG: regulator of PEP synthase PpsR (kinase-PPPase family) [Parasphingorhabdus sp.]|jgi:regulator of PEP synthase PpsR (kinase-PPPase family)